MTKLTLIKTSAQLVKELDKWFSLFVRLRDSDERGFGRCITCPEVRHYKDHMDAGHYISRKYYTTRWDEKNVHIQCKGCNKYGGGKLAEYAQFIITKYGIDTLTLLTKAKDRICRLADMNLPAMIEYYKGRVNEMLQEKHL